MENIGEWIIFSLIIGLVNLMWSVFLALHVSKIVLESALENIYGNKLHKIWEYIDAALDTPEIRKQR